MLDQGTEVALRKALEDRRLVRAKLESSIHDGGVAAAVTHHESEETPNILIVEVSGGSDEVMASLEELASVCDASTSVIIIGTENDIQLYRTLMDQGVSDYLVRPVDTAQLFETINGIISDPSAQDPARVIAFLGTRGGVGSSTIASNTAWCMGELLKEDVLLVDMDLQFGTGGLFFNQDLKRGVYDAVSDPDRMDQQLLEKIAGHYGDNLAILGAPARLEMPLELASEAVEKLIDTVSAQASFVVLDLPHIWSEWVLDALLKADEIVIVAKKDLVCLRNIQNILGILKKARADDVPIHIVVNMEGRSERTELTKKDFESTVGLPISFAFADDPDLFGAAENNGQPAAETSGRNKARPIFDDLAAKLAGAKKAEPKKKGTMAWLKGLR